MKNCILFSLIIYCGFVFSKDSDLSGLMNECNKNTKLCKKHGDHYYNLKKNEIAIQFYKKGCDLNDSDCCYNAGIYYEGIYDYKKYMFYNKKACAMKDEYSCKIIKKMDNAINGIKGKWVFKRESDGKIDMNYLVHNFKINGDLLIQTNEKIQYKIKWYYKMDKYYTVSVLGDKNIISYYVLYGGKNDILYQYNHFGKLTGTYIREGSFTEKEADKVVSYNPDIDPFNLKKGITYVITRKTPLMSSYFYKDPSSFKGIVYMYPNSSFTILSKVSTGRNPWYLVKYKKNKGYVYSVALVGQSISIKNK